MDANMITQQTFTQVFFKKFQTDNMLVNYLVQAVLLFIFGAVTTHILPRCQNYLNQLSNLFTRHLKRPQLRFTAKDSGNSWSPGISASPEFKAWLGRIREVIGSDDQTTLLMLQEFTQRSDYWSDAGGKKEKTTAWMPDQREPFRITDAISCEFSFSEEDAKSDGGPRAKFYTLTVFVSNERDREQLLTFHDELMAEYYEKARMTLNTKPHIFELQGYDKDTSEVKWSTFEFSSTRQLEHIWFLDKEKFAHAYENFLTGEAEYCRRGDPYTFSCLLYGTPGCGKTSLLKALVNDSVRRGKICHIFIVRFSLIETAKMLSKVIFDPEVSGHKVPMANRILVFEDFDAEGCKVFQKRFKEKDQEKADKHELNLVLRALERQHSTPNVRAGDGESGKKSQKSPPSGGGKQDSKDEDAGLAALLGADYKPKPKNDELTLSSVLNILDGINERTGQRVFWTTNACPPEDHFDPAFLRPGRMDMQIDFTRCTREGIKYLTEMYWGTKADESALMQLPDMKWTPAEVKQRCKEAKDINETLVELIVETPSIYGVLPRSASVASESAVRRARSDSSDTLELDVGNTDHDGGSSMQPPSMKASG